MTEFDLVILISAGIGLLWSGLLTGAILDIRGTLNRIEKLLEGQISK